MIRLPLRTRLAGFCRALQRFWRDESGVVMLETVLVFPLQLLVTMIIIQIAHMYTAANVLHYAAYQGTRTYAINFHQGQDAAKQIGNHAAWGIASTINNVSGGPSHIRVPNRRYAYADFDAFGQTQMRMLFGTTGDPVHAPECVAWGRLAYWLDLGVPVGGPFVYHVMPDAKTKVRPSTHGPIGQALMQQNARIYKPWPDAPEPSKGP